MDDIERPFIKTARRIRESLGPVTGSEDTMKAIMYATMLREIHEIALKHDLQEILEVWRKRNLG